MKGEEPNTRRLLLEQISDLNQQQFELYCTVEVASRTTELFSKEKTLRPGFSWRKGYGSAEVDAFNFMINTMIPVSDNTEIYAFGGKNYRDTNANAFSRDSYADGDNRSVPSLYPNGFTPQITSNIIDASISAGVSFLDFALPAISFTSAPI